VKDYARFSTQDFIEDIFFQKWVAKPDARSNAFWNQWIKDHPEKETEVMEAKSVIARFRFENYTLSNDEVSQLWNRIKSPSEVLPAERSSKPFWFKIAASVLLCASALYLYSQLKADAYLEYHTAYGETKSIVLPDSSTVILNSNSTVRFHQASDEKPSREIWLEGEAYFSVTHTKDHRPFRVNTDEGLSVEVLGTTFNVYHRIEQTKVVLNTGSIRLHLPEQSAAQNITMSPGDFVEYKKKSFSKKTVNPAIYTAWTEKKIILDHTSLRDMIDMMRDNYGVEVTVASDTLLNQTVSGSMPLEDAEKVVSQIAEIFDLQVSKSKNKYLMYE
jgi:ferric-dicitrate binding protein FerR (iron transport regulator)